MSLQGHLEDISIVDVLQVLGMAGKTGLLSMRKGVDRAEIGFKEGRVVAADLTPSKTNLTQLLVGRGHLNLEDTGLSKEALASAPSGLLAQLLASHPLPEEALLDVAGEFIQSVVNEIAAWTHGHFAFEPEKVLQSGPLSEIPREQNINVGISPTGLLMEAARIHDEAMSERGGDEPAREADEPEPEPAQPAAVLADQPRVGPVLKHDEAAPACLPGAKVVLLSPDHHLATVLSSCLAPLGIEFRSAQSYESARACLGQAGEAPSLLVVDTDVSSREFNKGLEGLQTVLQARRVQGRMPMLTFGTGKNPRLLSNLLAAGVMLHLPRPVVPSEQLEDSTLLFGQGLAHHIRKLSSAANLLDLYPEQALLSQVGTLHHSMLQMRRSFHSTSIALDLLKYVADHVQRAILFAIQDNYLVGMGGFGLKSARQDNVAKRVTRLRLPIIKDSVVQQVLSDRTVEQVSHTHKDFVFLQLYEVIGRPARMSALLIPLTVGGKTNSLIFADNDRLDEELYSPIPLGVLTEHANVVLENLNLRRKLAEGR